MNSRDFCYWLQGWFEINKTIDHRDGASKETLEMIEKHLGYVFTTGDLSQKPVTPTYDPLKRSAPGWSPQDPLGVAIC